MRLLPALVPVSPRRSPGQVTGTIVLAYPAGMALRLALVPVLIVLLGLCSIVSLIVFGATEPARVPLALEQSWLLIYLVQALLVGAVLYLTARLLGGRIDGAGLSAVIVAAYIGQLVVLATGLLPDIGQRNVVDEWVLLTGGPIQPTAAIVGALLGQPPQARRTDQQSEEVDAESATTGA